MQGKVWCLLKLIFCIFSYTHRLLKMFFQLKKNFNDCITYKQQTFLTLHQFIEYSSPCYLLLSNSWHNKLESSIMYSLNFEGSWKNFEKCHLWVRSLAITVDVLAKIWEVCIIFTFFDNFAWLTLIKTVVLINPFCFFNGHRRYFKTMFRLDYKDFLTNMVV